MMNKMQNAGIDYNKVLEIAPLLKKCEKRKEVLQKGVTKITKLSVENLRSVR